jgi:hypothetical protein
VGNLEANDVTFADFSATNIIVNENVIQIGKDISLTNPLKIGIGSYAGHSTQGDDTIAIGRQSGLGSQGLNSVAIGTKAGQSSQGESSIAIGFEAGYQDQANNTGLSIAIGSQAGYDTQSQYAVAIGTQAGYNSQGQRTVAVGTMTGQVNQSIGATAVGHLAGNTNQGANTVALGYGSGNSNQGAGAVAIGIYAGYNNQGSNSIGIGYYAGRTIQVENSIILNALGTALNADSSGLYVAPIRNSVKNNVLQYDTATKELVYGYQIDISGTITSSDISCGSLTVSGLIDTQNNDLSMGTGTIVCKRVTVDEMTITGDLSINKNLKIDGTFTDGNYTFDTNGNVTGLGTVGCGAITSTGDLAVTGTITGNTSITLDNITITIGELGVLDGVTPGTAGGSKALVLDSNLDITGLRNMTATGYIRGGYDTDSTSYFGRVALGYLGDLTKTDFASFSHVDKVGTSDYALLQGSDGTTSLNSSAGKNLHLRIGDATQFFIESTNKIGIGTEDSTLITEKLSVNGKVAALGYENFSDSRIKFDKKNIENGLNILKNLTPKLYNKLDDFDNSLNLRKEAGFIAQEVLMIDDISFVVKVREDGGLYTLDYGSIFAINVAATKELDSLVRNLRSEVDLLKDENKMMKGVLNKLLLKAGENTI